MLVEIPPHMSVSEYIPYGLIVPDMYQPVFRIPAFVRELLLIILTSIESRSHVLTFTDNFVKYPAAVPDRRASFCYS